MQFHTHSQSVVISLSTSSPGFLDCLCHKCLSLGEILQLGNVQTFKNVVRWRIICQKTMLATNVNQNPEMSSSPNLILNNSDNPGISSKDDVGRKIFIDQMSDLSPSEKSVVLFELSALRHWSSLGTVFAYRKTFSMLGAPVLRACHWFWSDEVIQRFSCFDFLDRL